MEGAIDPFLNLKSFRAPRTLDLIPVILVTEGSIQAKRSRLLDTQNRKQVSGSRRLAMEIRGIGGRVGKSLVIVR